MQIIKLDKRYIAHKDYGMQYCIELPTYSRNAKTIYQIRAIAWDMLMPSITMSGGCRQTVHHMLQYSWYVEHGVGYANSEDRVYFRTKEDMDKVLFMYRLKY